MVANLLGLLKLKVVRGINLAIRDSSSSDPYVILHIGKHKVKTGVKKKTTNPEWNEELTLSVEDRNIPLKLRVFDKDFLTPDDAMGHAEIDLVPLIETITQGLSSVPDGTVIKTIVPNRQNCYAEESKIYWSGGFRTQDMALRLKDVERGEIEMKVTWVNITGVHKTLQPAQPAQPDPDRSAFCKFRNCWAGSGLEL